MLFVFVFSSVVSEAPTFVLFFVVESAVEAAAFVVEAGAFVVEAPAFVAPSDLTLVMLLVALDFSLILVPLVALCFPAEAEPKKQSRARRKSLEICTIFLSLKAVSK